MADSLTTEGHNLPPRRGRIQGLAAANVEDQTKVQRLVSDRWGRLITTSDDESAAQEISYEFTYDTEDNLITVVKVIGTERWQRSYTYNANGYPLTQSTWSQV